MQVRSQLYPFSVAFTQLVNFGFGKTFPYATKLIGLDGTFWIFAGLTLVGCIFIIFCIPETKNKCAEDIAAFYNKTLIFSQSMEAVIESNNLKVVV